MQSGRFLRVIVASIALLACQASIAQPTASPLPMRLPEQDKNFYLLSLLENDAKVRGVLAADHDLVQITTERQHTARLIEAGCKGDAVCTVKAFLWTDEEIHAVSLDLARMAREDASLRALVDRQVRPSGAYILYEKQPVGEMLANAWEICARGLNDVISVYGEAQPPRYPRIDSISVDVKSVEFQKQISSLIAQSTEESSTATLFFEPSLRAALELLTLNRRDEAGRLEPMEEGVNDAAVKAIPSTRWQDYPYSVIVVPGAGPGDAGTALSRDGRKRCELAAEAFHARKAPFILVSGGYVHPSQTRFAEAIEMKKALIEEDHVPESAILVDPHARHTTTNMRNAAREMFRYNMPRMKAALVVSDASQIAYIAGQPFAERCLRELGYMPYRIVRRESDTTIVFMPLIESLQQDPMDPLDP